MWERAVSGESGIDVHEFAFLLEEPDEYQLRRVLRSFPNRDELLHRFGSYLFDPIPHLSDDDVRSLATQFMGEVARLADVLKVPDVAQAARCAEVTIDTASERPRWCTSDQLFEALFDQTITPRRHVHGGCELWEVAYGKSADSIICHHVTDPIIPFATNLSSYTTLFKSRRSVWLDGRFLMVSKPSTEPWLWADAPGWTPVLEWPTDVEIQRHQTEERLASDPATPLQVLVPLAQSGSPFVRAIVTRRIAADSDEPITDESAEFRLARAASNTLRPEAAAALANDDDEWVRAAVAANPATPAAVIATLGADPSPVVLRQVLRNPDADAAAMERALTHPDSIVRQNLAKRHDIPASMLEQLALDSEVYVRCNVAENPTTPDHVVVMLRDDPHRLVRKLATRA